MQLRVQRGLDPPANLQSRSGKANTGKLIGKVLSRSLPSGDQAAASLVVSEQVKAKLAAGFSSVLSQGRFLRSRVTHDRGIGKHAEPTFFFGPDAYCARSLSPPE